MEITELRAPLRKGCDFPRPRQSFPEITPELYGHRRYLLLASGSPAAYVWEPGPCNPGFLGWPTSLQFH